MNDAGDAEPSQLGLLDLSVGTSVTEVYSGKDFTLYLHIKNPFSKAVWLRSVELSLPTQLSWRAGEASRDHGNSNRRMDEKLHRSIAKKSAEIARLREEVSQLQPEDAARRNKIHREIASLEARYQVDSERLSYRTGHVNIDVRGDARLVTTQITSDGLHVSAIDGSQVVIDNIRIGSGDPERVPLQSSLPKGAALQPGSTDVWTIRLGSGRSPFFVPSKYNLQLTAIYSLTAPSPSDAETPTDYTSLYANTTSYTVTIRAALWSIILGGAIGGAVGSCAKLLQDAKSLGGHAGTSIGALLLAVILSGAAIIFSARKADAQTFVTVEDFWGGLLVGFLIGYSGTSAFHSITGV
jgi:hypothetical protein